ncbi:MAG: hypothetical protein HUJ75_04125, partial [Parasporobacterium sp.]|nr:hypothetical protein [Parasporobacterium sp.]
MVRNLKRLHRVTAVIAAAVMTLSLAACGGTGSNTAPEISGVSDMTIEVGAEINVLDGVTASDAEDGDLTSMITIEATPSLEFKNGKTVPETAGNYELVYSVKDKAGEIGEAYATLTVTKATGDAVLFKEFDFTQEQTVDAKGWTATIAEGVEAVGELKEGAYVFEIKDPGEGDGDIKLSLSGFEVKQADYLMKVWAKSTADTYTHIIARDENASDWVTFGGEFNVKIGQEIAPLCLNFTSDKKGSAELIMNLGRITPNPDNPSDTTPNDFKVTVDKIEIYEITGEEAYTALYAQDFSAADESSFVVSAGAGAAA